MPSVKGGDIDTDDDDDDAIDDDAIEEDDDDDDEAIEEDDDDDDDDEAIEEDDELGKAVGKDDGIGSVGGVAGTRRLARSLTLLTIFCIQLSRRRHAVNLYFRILSLE